MFEPDTSGRTKPGMAEAQMDKKEMDKKKGRKLLAWMVLGELFVGLGIVLWGRLQDDWRYMAIGALVVGQAMLIAMLLARTRAAKDPELARKVEAARAKARENSRRDARIWVVSLGIALPVIMGALMVRRYVPGFASLPKGDQRLYLMLGAIALVALGNLAWMAWRKRRSTAQP